MICICKVCKEPIDIENQNFITDDDGDYMHFACYCQSQDPDFFERMAEIRGNEIEVT